MSDTYIVFDASGRTDYPEAALAALEGLEVNIESRKITESGELVAQCQEADALLATGAPITREVMEALPKLKVIVRYGVGMDGIDLEAAEELGVVATNTRDFCTGEMADHCLMLLLACARNLMGYVKSLREGKWRSGVDRHINRLQGTTAGIVGFGDIGQALARRLSALGMRILCFDPYLDAAVATSIGAKPVSLESLLTGSDYVSLNCPLTEETRNLIGAAELALMKPGAFLINTSRGGVVDEDALIEALQEEQIAGAALDVLQVEPPPEDHPLLHMDHVIVTPHTAWYSEQAARDVVVGAFESLARLLPEFAPGAHR